MHFIQLTKFDGTPIAVNLNNVVYIETLDEHTCIWFNTEKLHFIGVKESFSDIISIIESIQRRNK